MPSKAHSRRKQQHALTVQVFIRLRVPKGFEVGRELLDEVIKQWIDEGETPDGIEIGAVTWKHGPNAPERRADTPDDIDRVREDLVRRLVQGGSIQFQSFRMRETIR